MRKTFLELTCCMKFVIFPEVLTMRQNLADRFPKITYIRPGSNDKSVQKENSTNEEKNQPNVKDHLN